MDQAGQRQPTCFLAVCPFLTCSDRGADLKQNPTLHRRRALQAIPCHRKDAPANREISPLYRPISWFPCQTMADENDKYRI